MPSSTGWIWRERHALDGDRDLDEVAGLGLEVRQPVEAADLPAGAGVGEAQLGDGVGPGEVAELALLLEVLGDVDLDSDVRSNSCPSSAP